MAILNNFHNELNNYNKKNICNPLKSLYEVEIFLNNLCKIKKSTNFAKQLNCLLKNKF